MTASQTPPSPSNEPSPQDPAQRDAEMVKRHYPVSILVKLLMVLIVLFVLMCIGFYYMAGTERGTKFFIEKVLTETGVKLEYGEGNLRDGLLVKDVALSASEDIEVHLINAYVKIGWRAIFAKEVHLRDADIDTIEIVNKKPATGEPFDYKTLKLPVNLRFDTATIDRIVYTQAGKDPVVVTDVAAQDLSWVETQVEVGEGNLQYSDVVNIAGLTGEITLEGDYPLDADAIVTVNSLEKVYIDPLDVQATGSLKRTYGRIQSKYNNDDISGRFMVQGMDDNAPFDAKLTWDEVDLPYAKGQEIVLRQGTAVASGVISDIDLRISTHLLAKDIPSGQYKARAKIVDSQMLIDRLSASTPEGELVAGGVLDWESEFTAKILAAGGKFDVRSLLPSSAAPYAPKYLDGQLAIVYQNQNGDGDMQINADLKQKDGEHINAKVVQGKKPDNARQQAPWYIDARWQNYTRVDVPDVGDIDSPSGTASVQLRDDKLWVDADAKINELNAAPRGDYQVKLNKVGDKINIRNLNYNGVMGDLSGQGNIKLASKKSPLTWQIAAKTRELLPQAFNKDLPISRLVGDIDANGQMIDISKTVNGKRVSAQRHIFTIKSSDLTATLASDDPPTNTATPRQIVVIGSGDGQVELVDGELQNFDARYQGRIESEGLPKGRIEADVNGTPKDINIKAFRHQGEAGGISGSGSINLSDGIKWDIKANAKQFNVGFFAPQTEGIVTGDLVTSGKWRSNDKPTGDLQAFEVKFDGAIDTPKLPQGKLVIDAGGDAKIIKLRKFSHIGEAGSLSAKGSLDVRSGLAWDISAVMDNFNLGYFVKEAPSTITGRVATTGTWKDDVQRIQISKMALNGQLKGKPLRASGNLNATLHLPTDMAAYLETLKSADTSGQVAKVKTVVETLNADNLAVKWADNSIVANGDANNLQAKVNITSLNQISDSLSGQVMGGMTLMQPKGQALPTIYVDLKGENIVLPSFELKDGVIKGKIVDFARSPSKLVVSAAGMNVAGSALNNINAVFDGTEKSHTLTFKVDTKQADTDLSVKGTIKGGFDRKAMSWRGALGNGGVITDIVSLTQAQPAQIVANFKGDNPKFQVAAHCWQANDKSGKLCLRDNLVASANQGQIDLAIQNLDTVLFSPFLPNDLTWQAKVNGKAQLGWQKGQKPNINATFYSDNGKIGMLQDATTESVTMPYKRVSVIVKSFPQGLKIRTDINSGRGARGYADIVVDPYKENKPISGALVLQEFNLAVLKPFFPGMRTLKGGITMAGGLGGTLTSPVFFGDANLKDASIAMLDLPVNLTNMNAKLKIRGQNASVDGSFMSGEGTGELTGTIDWENELQAKLRIKGENLVITQPPLLFAEVTPDVNIIVRPTQKYVNIVGAIAVPTATIRPPEANEEVITQSEDVVVLDRRLIGNIDEVLAITTPWSINADIGVDLGSNVNFRGFGAVLPLAGAIHVSQKGKGVMKAVGVVQVSRRSKIDAFGQNLELNYGQVRFNGDVMKPNLSIEAIKEIEGKTVGVKVKGNVADPNITVFNDAGLTEQQAMNALVTGKISNSGATQISQEGFKSEVTNNLAAAGLSLGLSGTRSLTNSIGEAFGLQKLTIDASGNADDTNVNVTGYITPDLYIRYGVGVFNAQSSLSLRYQLTRRFYIEATSAAENTVDLVYSFQF